MPSATRATLFKNATIISYDPASQLLKTLRNASMLIEDGRITTLAENDQIGKLPKDTEIFDATNKILSPGFVDTHHHLWQTAYRTLAANVTLVEYFARYGQRGAAKKRFTPDDLYLGQLAGLLELISCGTTTVLDYAHGTFSEAHIDASLKATFESGLRVFYAYTLDELDQDDFSFDQSLAKFRKMKRDSRFADSKTPVELGISCDKWALSDATWSKRIEQMADIAMNDAEGENPISVLTTHMVGGPYGANNSPTVLATALRSGSRSKPLPVVLGHASFLNEIEAMTLRDPHGRNPHLKMSLSTTPESEAHYGHTSTGADANQAYSSLGVDTHFTFSSSMVNQARLWLSSLRRKHYTQTLVENREIPANNPMAVNEAFLLATQKGGEALGRDDIGVIKEGACADVVVFGTEAAGLWGWRDPVAAVILHSGPGDVEALMVDGKWVKRGGKIVSPLVGGEAVEVVDIKKRFEASASRIQDIWEKELDPVVLKAGEEYGGGIAKFGTCREVHVQRH